MPPDQPPRRFAPTPVETSTKSSRQSAQPNGDGPRKFNVQPVETTTKSNKDNAQTNGGADLPAKRFAPQPIETSTKSSKDTPRRFAPDPVETSVKSSKDADQPPPQKARRFAPEPVEASITSSRKPEEPSSSQKPKSRFLPQPVETSTRSSRTTSPEKDESNPKDAAPTKPARRKFAPQLIDTAARTRKASDSEPTYSDVHKTDATPGENKTSYNNWGHNQTMEQASGATNEQPKFLPPFARRNQRSDSGRSHSFRLPDLETIESSESEPSGPPSLSTSPSSSDFTLGQPQNPLDQAYKHATRIRESVDETFSKYLLSLEAKHARDRLEDQALSAFPNSDFHEPVNHYVDDEELSDGLDDRAATWEGHEEDEDAILDMARNQRRRSSTHGTYEIREMRQHHEELEQERKAAGTTARRESRSSPWWNPVGQDNTVSRYRETELRQMRDRARPPMLGGDLQFPRSASPEAARFDVTQGSHQIRAQMCYLTEQSDIEVSPEGLWGGKKQQCSHSQSQQKSMHSMQSQNSGGPEGGLWGGFCKDSSLGQPGGGLAPPSGPTGLMTPLVEAENPFETFQRSEKPQPAGWALPPPTTLPQTPTESMDNGNSIDIILNDDKELDSLMEKEYPDTFVTQVYNYLSLGYPSLARPFDEELSKISKVPVSELRIDDEVAKTMPKGYIRLGEDFEGRGDGTDQELKNGGCVRWRALKLYIREWARQEKNMVKTEGLAGNWGTGARRGSWAW